MKTAKSMVENKIEIEKSVFITYVFPVSSLQSWENTLEDIREKYSKAKHICYAVIISEPQTERMSDAGEPKHTAGKPMLDVLKKQQLSNIAVVVVRYFGGIKLGKKLLLRTYVHCAVEALQKSEIVEITERYKYTLKVSLQRLDKVLANLARIECEVLSKEINEQAKLIVISVQKNLEEEIPYVDVIKKERM